MHKYFEQTLILCTYGLRQVIHTFQIKATFQYVCQKTKNVGNLSQILKRANQIASIQTLRRLAQLDLSRKSQ